MSNPGLVYYVTSSDILSSRTNVPTLDGQSCGPPRVRRVELADTPKNRVSYTLCPPDKTGVVDKLGVDSDGHEMSGRSPTDVSTLIRSPRMTLRGSLKTSLRETSLKIFSPSCTPSGDTLQTGPFSILPSCRREVYQQVWYPL